MRIQPRAEQRHGYELPARLLHWLAALAIFAALGLGLWMTRLPAETEAEVATVFRAYSVHKTIGMAVLALGMARILWAILRPGPGPLHPERAVETFLARLIHRFLWIGLLALPATGLLYHSAAPGFAPILWPFGQALPFVPADEALALAFRNLHEAAGWLAMAALAFHIAGTLKHALIDRDATLARMTAGTGPSVPPARRAILTAALALALWIALLTAAWFTAPLPEPDPFDVLDGLETFDDLDRPE